MGVELLSLPGRDTISPVPFLGLGWCLREDHGKLAHFDFASINFETDAFWALTSKGIGAFGRNSLRHYLFPYFDPLENYLCALPPQMLLHYMGSLNVVILLEHAVNVFGSIFWFCSIQTWQCCTSFACILPAEFSWNATPVLRTGNTFLEVFSFFRALFHHFFNQFFSMSLINAPSTQCQHYVLCYRACFFEQHAIVLSKLDEVSFLISNSLHADYTSRVCMPSINKNTFGPFLATYIPASHDLGLLNINYLNWCLIQCFSVWLYFQRCQSCVYVDR